MLAEWACGQELPPTHPAGTFIGFSCFISPAGALTDDLASLTSRGELQHALLAGESKGWQYGARW